MTEIALATAQADAIDRHGGEISGELFQNGQGPAKGRLPFRTLSQIDIHGPQAVETVGQQLAVFGDAGEVSDQLLLDGKGLAEGRLRFLTFSQLVVEHNSQVVVAL